VRQARVALLLSHVMTVIPGALGLLGASSHTGAQAHRVSGHGTRRLLGHGPEDANHTRQSQSSHSFPTATMLSYFNHDSHEVLDEATRLSTSLSDHTLLHRAPYASSNTLQTPHGERLASLTPTVFPLFLANTFVDDTSSPFFNDGVPPRTLRTVADTGICTRSPTAPHSLTLLSLCHGWEAHGCRQRRRDLLTLCLPRPRLPHCG